MQQADLRTERAFIYKELAQLEIKRARMRFNEQLTSPATLTALAGAGMFVGTLKKPDNRRLRDIQAQLATIEENLRDGPPNPPHHGSDEHESSDLRSFIVSMVTSVLTRTVTSYLAAHDVDAARSDNNNR